MAGLGALSWLFHIATHVAGGNGAHVGICVRGHFPDGVDMTVDRKLKKSLRANLLLLGDAALQYVREEAER